MKRSALVPWVVLAFATFAVAFSEAQVDLAKTLVGRWEGEVQFLVPKGRPDPNRTLIIASVIQRDGKWLATGRFGVTGRGLGPVQIEVDASDARPAIRFAVSGSNATVRLELLDEKHLVGTLAQVGAGGPQGSDHRPMKLEKRE